MSKADTIEAFLYNAVGCGYIWGATGWVSSPAKRNTHAKEYDEKDPALAEKIRTTCKKWDGLRCYDCAQLIVQAAKLIGLKLPSGATSLWKADIWAEKGTIDTAPEGKLICIFRDDMGVKQHVGWKLRNGDVIDARGTDSGVVLNKKYSAWSHWGILRGLDDEVEVEIVSNQGTIFDGRLRLRKEPNGAAEMLCWLPDGAKVDVLEKCGEWLKVQYEGKVGYCMGSYVKWSGQLDGADVQAEPGMVTLTIPRETALLLLQALESATAVG